MGSAISSGSVCCVNRKTGEDEPPADGAAKGAAKDAGKVPPADPAASPAAPVPAPSAPAPAPAAPPVVTTAGVPAPKAVAAPSRDALLKAAQAPTGGSKLATAAAAAPATAGAEAQNTDGGGADDTMQAFTSEGAKDSGAKGNRRRDRQSNGGDPDGQQGGKGYYARNGGKGGGSGGKGGGSRKGKAKGKGKWHDGLWY